MTDEDDFQMQTNCINSLEHGTVSVTFQELNIAYTDHYHELGKLIHEARRFIELFHYRFDKNRIDNTVRLHHVHKAFYKYSIFLKNIRNSLQNHTSRISATITSLQQKINHLTHYNRLTDYSREGWHEMRINRVIIDYLQRAGYFKSAELLSRRTGTANLCHISIFQEAEQVKKGLDEHDLKPLVKWIEAHKFRLKILGEDIMVRAYIQECIELLKAGKPREATSLAKLRFKMIPESSWESSDILKLMCLIGTNMKLSKKYSELLSDNRWYMLKYSFRFASLRSYMIDNSVIFNSAFCTGIACHKTPSCGSLPNEKCVVCSPKIFPLSVHLPHAELENSQLICHHCQTITNDDNPPYLLPSGFIYCARSIEEMASGDEVNCMVTGAKCSRNEVLRIFALM